MFTRTEATRFVLLCVALNQSIEEESGHHLAQLFRLETCFHHQSRVVEKEANDLAHLADNLTIAQTTRLEKRQVVILWHFNDILHLGELLLALWWLFRQALWEHDSQEIRLIRAESTTDDCRIRARCARREDMVALHTHRHRYVHTYIHIQRRSNTWQNTDIDARQSAC